MTARLAPTTFVFTGLAAVELGRFWIAVAQRNPGAPVFLVGAIGFAIVAVCVRWGVRT